jgi:hypothetical protein
LAWVCGATLDVPELGVPPPAGSAAGVRTIVTVRTAAATRMTAMLTIL